MRVTWIGAIGSLVLAVAAGLGLALWPCAYQGVEVAGGGGPDASSALPWWRPMA